MIRLIGVLIVAGLIAFAAFWLASIQGTLTLSLPSYEIRTGAGTAAILLIFLVLALMIVLRLIWFVIRAPRHLARRSKPPAPPRGGEAAP